MRAVVQRVTNASVEVNEEVVGNIDKGLLVFIGVTDSDNEKDTEYLLTKILNLRIFEDEQGKMNLSLLDINGEILIVSQFTLYGDCRKGRRPNFTLAGNPNYAQEIYNDFVVKCREYGIRVETGVFGANMDVKLVNDGPVTMLLDSTKIF